MATRICFQRQLLLAVTVVALCAIVVANSAAMRRKRARILKIGNNVIVRKSPGSETRCGRYLRPQCIMIAARCHVSMLSKRSIPDDEEEALEKVHITKRSKLSSKKRSRRRRIRKFRVNCFTCQSRCWN